MTAKTLSNGLLRTLFIILGIAVLIWFFVQIQTIIIYIITSAVLALVARPLIRFLTSKTKLKNALAAFIAILVYLLIIVLFASAFSPLISKQSENIALLNSDTFKENLEKISIEINNYLLSRNISVLERLESFNTVDYLKNIPNVVNIILGGIGSFGMGLFSVLFITFFLMLDAKLLKRSIFSFIPKKHITQTARSLNEIKNLLTRYFIGLFLQIMVLFIIYIILLVTFNIDNAIIIALLCALFNLIPYIGPLLGALVMFTLSATNNLDLNFSTEILPNTTYIMVGYFIAQMVDNFISQPLIFSKSVKSHPLEIFLVILIFGNIFGVVGMVICIPCYTAIKVIAKEFFSRYTPVQMLTKDL